MLREPTLRASAKRVHADQLMLRQLAHRVLRASERTGTKIVTAESCTGGLLATLLTDEPGYGKWFDRGIVAYTNEAKQEQLGVPARLLDRYGPVSAQVAHSMAQGALMKSQAGIAVAVTGYAGPGETDEEPGLVFLSVMDRQGHCILRDYHFGDIGRDATRQRAAAVGLELLECVLKGRIGHSSPIRSAFRFGGDAQAA